MSKLTFNKKNLISKDQIPNNTKLISADIKDYRAKIPEEKIIKNCASTGEYVVCDNNLFFQRETESERLSKNFKDPWIQLKCIPDGKIVNHNTVITREGNILMGSHGFNFHYGQIETPNGVDKLLRDAFCKILD